MSQQRFSFPAAQWKVPKVALVNGSVVLLWLLAGCSDILCAQWHASADWKRLREKAVIDAGELTVQKEVSQERQELDLGADTEEQIDSEPFEWLEFRGYGTYCMPRGTVPDSVSREAALLLMDVERKVYIGVLRASGGLVRVGVHRADLVKCP